MIIAHVLTSILKHKEMFQMIKVMAYLPAEGHNTDGFDCSTTDLTIQNRDPSTRTLSSLATPSLKSLIDMTTAVSDQALRIKTKALATNSTVTNITYSVGSAV
ncbi:hypothetical protein JR316_0001867 [Psilocybe cubensis]|uniref:Uncharacterized protein n=1 Tax=Psilocybe cubensis TaxID=181762 RepID=A0ACB8HAY7_PSICU|nr:hypothetical protein JR316_0001867 [Psilocybe cubensis]KAH9484963.1 hypothetical protein JR316_0001867 [Psilocybe cubensis]